MNRVGEPDCDICGRPKSGHVEITGGGLICPIAASVYRPKRETGAERAAIVADLRKMAGVGPHRSRILTKLADRYERGDHLE